jgi:endo-1,4-beta-xylanase
MLKAGAPNLEMHIYGRGVHVNGLEDRDGTPFGKWQDRFMDWFRDLGFLQKPGQETRAAADLRAYVSRPPRGAGRRAGGAADGNASGGRGAANTANPAGPP